MRNWPVIALMSSVLFSVVLVSQARGPCPFDWRPADTLPGLDGSGSALATWDPDGAGPQPPVLVAGGTFTVASNVLANNIAVWNGTSWSAPGTGMNGGVRALSVYKGN